MRQRDADNALGRRHEVAERQLWEQEELDDRTNESATLVEQMGKISVVGTRSRSGRTEGGLSIWKRVGASMVATVRFIRGTESTVERPVIPVWAGITSIGLAIALVICGTAVAPGTWHPGGAFLTLFALTWFGDLTSRRFGALSFTNVTLPLGVAVALFGALPSVTMSAVVFGFDVRRQRWTSIANTLFACTMFCVPGALVLDLARRSGGMTSASTSLGLWAMVALLVSETCNFTAAAWGQQTAGQPLKTIIRLSLLPALPGVALAVAGVGLTVYSYEEVGYVALPASALLAGTLGWTVDLLWRGERRLLELDESIRERDELSRQLVSAEERARRALAADLHDDALQLLAVARHDLEDGALERVREHLGAVDASLRDLLVRLDAFGTRTTVAAAFEELVAMVGERSGLRIETQVDPALDDTVDADLVSCARELLLNVEKHAQATHVWISAALGELTVSDDGRGGDVDIPAALERGHVGLALVAQRARERGGELRFARRPHGGLAATVTFRRGGGAPAAPVPERAAAGLRTP